MHELKTRILESLRLIDRHVTVDELRTLGNIPRTDMVLLCALGELEHEGTVKKSADYWGHAGLADRVIKQSKKYNQKPDMKKLKAGYRNIGSNQYGRFGQVTKKVIPLVVDGKDTRTIADELGISYGRAYYHRCKAIRKLNQQARRTEAW